MLTVERRKGYGYASTTISSFSSTFSPSLSLPVFERGANMWWVCFRDVAVSILSLWRPLETLLLAAPVSVNQSTEHFSEFYAFSA